MNKIVAINDDTFEEIETVKRRKVSLKKMRHRLKELKKEYGKLDNDIIDVENVKNKKIRRAVERSNEFIEMEKIRLHHEMNRLEHRINKIEELKHKKQIEKVNK